jgi:hypothetical protein
MPAMPPDAVDAADPIELIGSAAAVLAEYPGLAPIAEHLLSYPADLIEQLTGAENSTGRSVRDAILLARRNTLLRRLGETASPTRLAGELNSYYTTAWRHDRTKVTNPYQAGDRRATLWSIFRLRPQAISLRHVRVILGRQS